MRTDDERAAQLERLFRRYVPGDRVRAWCDILDATIPAQVFEGQTGTVEDGRAHGVSALVLVQWDNGPRFLTSADNLEPGVKP